MKTDIKSLLEFAGVANQPRAKALIEEAVNAGKIATYIGEWFDEADDPNFEAPGEAFIAKAVKNTFSDEDPTAVAKITKYIVARIGDPEQLPMADEIASWIKQNL